MIKKIIRKSILMFMIVVLAGKTFSAVVSDNDGTAFISYSEYDSLRSDFQKVLDGFNTGIDAKIANAIAQYIKSANSETTEKVSMLFTVNADTKYKPKSVRNKTNTIKKQTFQGGTYLNNLWATFSWNIASADDLNPWKLENMTQLALLGEAYYDQMKGFVFKNNNPEVLVSKYDYDNCSLTLSQTSTQNQNYGNGYTGDRFLMGIQPGTLTGKKIDTNYVDMTGIGNGAGNYGCGTKNSWLVAEDTISSTVAKNNWLDVLPMNAAFANKYALKNNYYTYDEYIWGGEYMISHAMRDEDYNVYVYPECHDVIYAHADDENEIEEYRDYMTDVATADKIGGEYTNLYLTGKTERWMWWRYNGASDVIIGPRRNWRFTPKFKLKNTTTKTSVKPNTDSVSGGALYWNTLDQFKNGKIKYVNHQGVTSYPHFYGGLPLIAINNNAKKFSFDISLSPTISTSTNNFCIRVMSEEFPNGNNISTWSTSKKRALQKIKGESKAGSTTTVYNYDNTNNYLVVPKNTTINISIENPVANKTYFIRWWEEGDSGSAGGQIDLLGNGEIVRNS